MGKIIKKLKDEYTGYSKKTRIALIIMFALVALFAVFAIPIQNQSKISFSFLQSNCNKVQVCQKRLRFQLNLLFFHFRAFL